MHFTHPGWSVSAGSFWPLIPSPIPGLFSVPIALLFHKYYFTLENNIKKEKKRLPPLGPWVLPADRKQAFKPEGA